MDDYRESGRIVAVMNFVRGNLAWIICAAIGLALASGVFFYAKQRAAERETAARVLLEQAKGSLREGELDESRRFLDMILEDYGEVYGKTSAFEEALLYRGRLSIASGDLDEAAVYLARYLDEYPDGDFLPEAYSEMGFIHEEGGDPAGAENYYTRVFRRFPGHYLAPKSMADAARCLAAMNESSAAEALYQTLLAAYPRSAFAETAERELEKLHAGE